MAVYFQYFWGTQRNVLDLSTAGSNLGGEGAVARMAATMKQTQASGFNIISLDSWIYLNGSGEICGSQRWEFYIARLADTEAAPQ